MNIIANRRGLYLSIVSRIVERYGGRIAVQSEVGKGTTFSVHLPLIHAAPATTE